MQKNKGFTLVELLSVIVILAVILVIAVPQIMSVIESARKGSIESTAKLIAEGAEREYTNRKILGKDTNVLCSDVSSMNSNDYGTCVITFDNRGKATVKVTGKGKFEGYTCNGNSTNMECVKGEIPESTETDAQYFAYSEVEGGINITGYLVGDGVNDVIVKDKDKCVAYLQSVGVEKEQANTLCSGGAVDGTTLKDGVLQGDIISSKDYSLAGLEVTYKNGGGTDVVIPSEIDGKKVVAIADNAFTSAGVTPTTISNTKKVSVSYLNNNKKDVAAIPLIGIPLPDGLGITSVVIPSTVKSIGDRAFVNNQLTEVVIPSSVTSIGDSAFFNNQLVSLTISGSVGGSAFGNNKLTTLTLLDGVVSIGGSAFDDNQLTEVVIPSSVTSIGRGAFSKSGSSNQNLSKIVNKTGKSFEWGNIISYYGSAVYNFITGTVPNNYGNVEVVSG